MIRVLEREPALQFALLFGSAATRGPEAARDFDVAVSFDRTSSLLALGRLEGDLERVARRSVDLVDLDGATTLLRHEVARDGQVLLCRNEDALRSFRARAALEYFDLEPHRRRQAEGLRRALGVAL